MVPFFGALRRCLFSAIQQTSGISTSSPPGPESDQLVHTDEWDGDKSDHEALHTVDHVTEIQAAQLQIKNL